MPANKSDTKYHLHLYLGKKDVEILLWKKSLPPRCFKYYLEQILLGYITGQKVYVPPVNTSLSVDFETAPIHIVLSNPQIVSFLSPLSQGEKSKNVKEILLYYIRESKSGQYVSSGKKSKKTSVPNVPVFTGGADIQNTPVSKVASASEKNIENNFSTDNHDKSETAVKKNKKSNSQNSKEHADNEIAGKKVNIPLTAKKPKKDDAVMQALFKMSGDM